MAQTDEHQIINACTRAIEALAAGSVDQEIRALHPGNSCSPESRALLESTRHLVEKFAEARAFISALAAGQIHVDPPRKNQLVAAHKELHSALQHLVWQLDQVAEGNYNLRIDFLGEFSESFNTLIASLSEKKRIETDLSASEARSLRAEAVARMGHWEYHLAHDRIYGSPGTYRIFGLENKPLSLMDIQDRILLQYRISVEAALKYLIEEGEPYDIEFRIADPVAGEERDLHSIAEYDAQKGIVFGVVQDITERKRSEELLDYQYRFQEMIAELSADFISATHRDLDAKIDKFLKSTGEFFDVDRAYLFQLSADGKKFDNTHEWCAPGVEPQISRMQDISLDAFPWWAEQIRKRKNVSIPDVDALPPQASAEKEEFHRQQIKSILCVPIVSDGEVMGLFGFDSVRERRVWPDDQIAFFKVAANIVSSALQKHRLVQELIRTSISDQVTDLYNRRYLHLNLPLFIEEYKRTRIPFAAVFFDLDHFKKLNDTYGHLAGDFILQQFASLLKENIRPFDIACRYGGEEFILIAKSADSTTARSIAERILEKARSRDFEFDGKTLRFTLSCGITDCRELSDEALTAEALIEIADRRLYLAKEQGRNRCIFGD